MTAVNDYNRSLIDEFRANDGNLSGTFADTPLLLLTTTGAKSGRRHTTPVVYLVDDAGPEPRVVVFVVEGGRAHEPGLVPQPPCEPDRHRRVAG